MLPVSSFRINASSSLRASSYERLWMSVGVSATPVRLARAHFDHLTQNRAVGEDGGQPPPGAKPGDRHHHGAVLVPGQAVAPAQDGHGAERLQPPALGVKRPTGAVDAP